MNTPTFDESIYAELADGALEGAAWEVLRAAHPDAAAEIALARQVRLFMAEVQTLDITVSADFEARLLARLHEDATFRDFFELWFSTIGHVLVDLLNLALGLLPAPQPQPQAA